MVKCDVLDSQTSVRMPIVRTVPAISLHHPGTFDFRIPTKSTSVPGSPIWLHEIKYDGHRLRLERDRAGVDAQSVIDGIGVFLSDQLSRYKHPESFEIVSFSPRDDSGKVCRTLLRDERAT
jgi:acyl-CoA synthetase (AMP-forming)/AMP-acid ligase II